MPERFELRLQFAVIVDLAIERDPDGTIFVGKWLMTA